LKASTSQEASKQEGTTAPTVEASSSKAEQKSRKEKPKKEPKQKQAPKPKEAGGIARALNRMVGGTRRSLIEY
jgi:hypothetical protein